MPRHHEGRLFIEEAGVLWLYLTYPVKRLDYHYKFIIYGMIPNQSNINATHPCYILCCQPNSNPPNNIAFLYVLKPLWGISYFVGEEDGMFLSREN